MSKGVDFIAVDWPLRYKFRCIYYSADKRIRDHFIGSLGAQLGKGMHQFKSHDDDEALWYYDTWYSSMPVSPDKHHTIHIGLKTEEQLTYMFVAYPREIVTI